jgi:hypothetical protein
MTRRALGGDGPRRQFVLGVLPKAALVHGDSSAMAVQSSA